MANPHISVIVPVYNEEGNVGTLHGEIVSAVSRLGWGYEIIFVDDGSTDGTATALARLSPLKVIRLQANSGQSAALYAGIQASCGQLCVLMDGDGQNDPADIGALLEVFNSSGARLVCGYRHNRQDTLSRRWAGKIGNIVRRMVLLDDGVRDTTCGLKAFYREDARHLVPFDGLHRYIPAMFRHAGLSLVEVPVSHRPRHSGKSKYGIFDRAWKGVFDLIGLRWLLSRKIHSHKHIQHA